MFLGGSGTKQVTLIGDLFVDKGFSYWENKIMGQSS
jgi:hypothetical protein